MILYSERQIALIHTASKVAVACLKEVIRAVRSGVTTKELDEIAALGLKKRGATSPFLGYRRPNLEPFPATICTSVNDVVIHGIPNDVKLVAGDVLSIDLGAQKDGYIGDTAYTVIVDENTQQFYDELRLCAAAEQGLWKGIASVSDGNSLGSVAYAVQNHVEGQGCSVVREFCGHGVGGSLHEWPNVPNYFTDGLEYPKLRKGMVFTIEPMVVLGSDAILKGYGPLAHYEKREPEWPVRTFFGAKSAHYEHTLAVGWDGKVQVLTNWEQKTGD